MGPTTERHHSAQTHFDLLRRKKALYDAWRKVYDNGIHSKSKETKDLVKEYNANIVWNIESVYRKLLKGNFKFKPSRGVPKPREGKPPRPIVVSPLENRIVQRSILDSLQDDKAVSKYVSTPYSFGGIKDPDTSKSVSGAISELKNAIARGAKWYVRSDIKVQLHQTTFCCRRSRT
jgi:RNA-directed DNA polymerase